MSTMDHMPSTLQDFIFTESLLKSSRNKNQYLRKLS